MSFLNEKIGDVLKELNVKQQLLDKNLSKLPETHQKTVVPIMADMNRLNRSIQNLDLNSVKNDLSGIKNMVDSINSKYGQDANISK